MAYRRNRWYRYDRNNGLNSDRCTGACFLGDGSIWFATQGGLAHYQPPVDHPPDAPPAVVINGARSRFGGQLSESGLTQIPPGEADISVDFSVSSTVLDSPPPVRYRLNAREEWRTTSRRSLEFLQLGAGDYPLQVEAQGLNGTWTAAPARLAFRVPPPWWATWWFRLSGALALAGLLALAWRTRIRAAANVHLERLRAMVDRYPGVVFVLDPAGRFVLANRRLEQYTRQPAGGLNGRFPSEVMTPENAANFEGNHRRLLAKGDLMEYREDYKVPTGKVVFDIRACGCDRMPALAQAERTRPDPPIPRHCGTQRRRPARLMA